MYPTAGLEIKDFTDAEYTLIENDLHTYTSAYRKSGWRDSGYGMGFVLSNKQYTELKQKMLKSVYENEGFYVGKYETGVEGSPRTSGSESEDPTEIPVIKPNAYPYNFVTFGQAQTLATNIESGEYTSSLLFGVQWDLMLKYLEIKGATETELNNDSTNWGNYANSVWNVTNTNSKYSTDDEGKNWITKAYGSKAAKTKVLLSTGASDIFSKQGIYDIAGNVSEWTLESTTDLTTPVSVRGGYYIYNGNREPANYHEWGYDLATDAVIGFRITLY